jgi:hypothetical protein
MVALLNVLIIYFTMFFFGLIGRRWKVGSAKIDKRKAELNLVHFGQIISMPYFTSRTWGLHNYKILLQKMLWTTKRRCNWKLNVLKNSYKSNKSPNLFLKVKIIIQIWDFSWWKFQTKIELLMHVMKTNNSLVRSKE